LYCHCKGFTFSLSKINWLVLPVILSIVYCLSPSLMNILYQIVFSMRFELLIKGKTIRSDVYKVTVNFTFTDYLKLCCWTVVLFQAEYCCSMSATYQFYWYLYLSSFLPLQTGAISSYNYLPVFTGRRRMRKGRKSLIVELRHKQHFGFITLFLEHRKTTKWLFF